jgi:hypothetical protein
LAPISSTLFFAAEVAALAIASIALGATSLMMLVKTPLPFLHRFGLTTPKPVTPIMSLRTSPITPVPFLGRPLLFGPTPSPSIGLILSSICRYISKHT